MPDPGRLGPEKGVQVHCHLEAWDPGRFTELLRPFCGTTAETVKRRVFVGRYGWLRSKGRPSGRSGSQRSLRTVESDRLDPADQVGNTRELPAGQDPRNEMRDKGRKVF